MSKFKINYPSGATAIAFDEIKDLKLDYISTMQELNEAEQANIADAYLWVEKQDLSELLTGTFVFKLHERMFNQVWKWAGKMRRSNKNIGVMKENIMNTLGQLLKDTEYWIEKKTFSDEEIAVRLHHGLVQIHIFPNGNGRHARLMADLFMLRCGKSQFGWGAGLGLTSLEVEGVTRQEYIKALRAADQGHFAALIQFARK